MKQPYVIAIILAILLSGCEYEHNLCGGYSLVRMNGSEVRLCGPGNSIRVNGTIEKYAVKEPYITGNSRRVEWMDPHLEPHPGYFLVNTSTNELKAGLSEEQWQQELALIGWQSPNLSAPW